MMVLLEQSLTFRAILQAFFLGKANQIAVAMNTIKTRSPQYFQFSFTRLEVLTRLKFTGLGNAKVTRKWVKHNFLNIV